MNEDVLKGKWKELKGNVKATFGKLTDDDLLEVEGNSEAMVGRLQARYGYTRDEAESKWNEFVNKVDHEVDQAAAERHVDRAVDHVKDAVDDAKNAVRRALD